MLLNIYTNSIFYVFPFSYDSDILPVLFHLNYNTPQSSLSFVTAPLVAASSLCVCQLKGWSVEPKQEGAAVRAVVRAKAAPKIYCLATGTSWRYSRHLCQFSLILYLLILALIPL